MEAVQLKSKICNPIKTKIEIPSIDKFEDRTNWNSIKSQIPNLRIYKIAHRKFANRSNR